MQLDQRKLGFFHLGFADFDRLFQSTVMPQPGLDQFLLESCGLILLSLQLVLVLEGKLFLLVWKPE
jgi:hypothetical protein